MRRTERMAKWKHIQWSRYSIISVTEGLYVQRFNVWRTLSVQPWHSPLFSCTFYSCNLYWELNKNRNFKIPHLTFVTTLITKNPVLSLLNMLCSLVLFPRSLFLEKLSNSVVNLTLMYFSDLFRDQIAHLKCRKTDNSVGEFYVYEQN